MKFGKLLKFQLLCLSICITSAANASLECAAILPNENPVSSNRYAGRQLALANFLKSFPPPMRASEIADTEAQKKEREAQREASNLKIQQRHEALMSLSVSLNRLLGALKIDLPKAKFYEEPSTNHPARAYATHNEINMELGGEYSLKSYLAIFAHEFGHLVFFKFSKIHLDGQLSSLEELFNSAQTAPQTDWDTHFEMNPTLLKVYKLSLPFNELFADLVASLYFNDPKIMGSALAETYNGGDMISRNFSPPRRFKRFIQSNFLNLRKTNLNEMALFDVDPYSVLDTARVELWDMIHTQLVANISAEQILSCFLRATERQLQAFGPLLVDAQVSQFSLAVNSKKLNQEFLQLFALEAKRAGIWKKR